MLIFLRSGGEKLMVMSGKKKVNLKIKFEDCAERKVNYERKRKCR